jgi:hypothetical protein
MCYSFSVAEFGVGVPIFPRKLLFKEYFAEEYDTRKSFSRVYKIYEACGELLSNHALFLLYLPHC